MGKKKEKVTYVDDGRTIADMSGVSGGMRPGEKRNRCQPRAGLKEQFSTFWNAMKMMFLPMLVVVGGIVLVYLIITVIFRLAY